MKALYQILKERVETECTSIKHVRLFNNQFERSNNANIDNNVQEAFAYPCVFISFPGDNEVISGGYGAKRLDVMVNIKIGFETYRTEDLVVFDVAEEVQTALENYSTDGMTGLVYEAQRMDYDHDMVIIYEFDFRTQWSDETKYTKKNDIEVNNLTLEITQNLDIDNQIIRSGDGT